MPGGHEKPLHLQPTADLWVGIIGVPGFGGLLLAAPLMGTPVDGSWWTTLRAVFLFGGLFAFMGVLVGMPRLTELRHRGSWVPPGTARRPLLVSIALAILLMAAGVAVQFAVLGLVRLSGLAS